MSKTIHRKNVRALLLEIGERMRPGQFTRVSDSALDKVEDAVHIVCGSVVTGQARKGRTIR
jgi:hypothetical protein